MLACLVAMAACGSQDAADSTPRGYEPPARGYGSSPAGSSSPDRGDFVLRYVAPRTGEDRLARRLIAETGVMEGIVSGMNESIALPRDIEVLVKPTDDGPYYDPSTRTLLLGYPFVAYVANVFDAADPSQAPRRLAERTVDVVAFVLLHEMGHALVDQLDIPITGREEDAVDNLATVLAGYIDEQGTITLDFADFFSLLQADPATLQATDFWDEHSLDIQRANDAACLLYGSSPRRFGALGRQIPAARRVRCPEQWRQVERSWGRLLGDSIKS